MGARWSTGFGHTLGPCYLKSGLALATSLALALANTLPQPPQPRPTTCPCLCPSPPSSPTNLLTFFIPLHFDAIVLNNLPLHCFRQSCSAHALSASETPRFSDPCIFLSYLHTHTRRYCNEWRCVCVLVCVTIHAILGTFVLKARARQKQKTKLGMDGSTFASKAPAS